MSWWDRVTQWNERHRFGIDVTVTAATGFFLVLLSGPLGNGDVLTGFWALATWAPLAWRRRNPVTSVVLVYSAGLLHLFLGAPRSSCPPTSRSWSPCTRSPSTARGGRT
jgi:hypothetical protein